MKAESMVQANELCFRAGRWLTPRWAAYDHIHQINTRMNSLRAWIPGIWQLKLLQTIPPKCNWKMDLPPPARKSSGWRWTDSCSGCETPSCSRLSALWWCCSGVQVLATGTGDCCAIPSGGQEQQGPGHSSEWAGKWTFAVRVHYPTFQQ